VYNGIRYNLTTRRGIATVDPIVLWTGNGGHLQPAPDQGPRRTCPEELRRVAERKLDQLNAAITLGSLRIPPGNHLEALAKDRDGQHSIRINDQYRICLVWTDEGPSRVEITDYH
jgi:proteic killer suppression protein